MRQEHQDGVTYLLRNILKANWMKLHRILTMMLVVSLVIHIFQMGIKLPYAISSLGKSTGSSQGNNVEQIEVVDDSDSLVTFSGATLKDGTYEGSADGYASVITVSVVVENCAVISGELKIMDIQISNSHGHGKPHHRPEH